jgi:hypothetical protein
MAEETSGRFVGPMPIQLFLDKFLPLQPDYDPPAVTPRNTFQTAVSSKLEKTMSEQLVRSSNSVGHPKTILEH